MTLFNDNKSSFIIILLYIAIFKIGFSSSLLAFLYLQVIDFSIRLIIISSIIGTKKIGLIAYLSEDTKTSIKKRF